LPCKPIAVRTNHVLPLYNVATVAVLDPPVKSALRFKNALPSTIMSFSIPCKIAKVNSPPRAAVVIPNLLPDSEKYHLVSPRRCLPRIPSPIPCLPNLPLVDILKRDSLCYKRLLFCTYPTSIFTSDKFYATTRSSWWLDDDCSLPSSGGSVGAPSSKSPPSNASVVSSSSDVR